MAANGPTTQTNSGAVSHPGAGAVHTVPLHFTAPVTAGVIALAMLLALGGGLLAGSVGGWRAARLRPAVALAQGECPASRRDGLRATGKHARPHSTTRKGTHVRAHLDEDTRGEIVGLREKLWRELGLTLVLVTHDSSVASRAQRVGQMRNGRLTFCNAAGTAAGAARNRRGRDR